MKKETPSHSLECELAPIPPTPNEPVLHERCDCVVVIPTYNEIDTIGELISRVLAHARFNVLVVDDSSPDGTGLFVATLPEYGGRLRLISRASKLGLGSAYLAGFQRALEEGAQFIFEMDADFSHDPDTLPDLLAAAESGYDLVLGSRYVRGGGTSDWGAFRKLISRGGNFYARSILGLEVRDCTSGFRCYRREVVDQLCSGVIKSNGYSFQIETLHRALKNGFRVGEVPILFSDRRVGASKMTYRDVIEALIRVWKLRVVNGRTGENASSSPADQHRSQAPKARNVIAQSDALGIEHPSSSALKVRDKRL